MTKASAFLVTSLTDGDHVVGAFGPDLGQSADVALGLAASGDQPATLAAVVSYLADHAGEYVHGSPAFGEKADANYAGPTGKLLLVAQATGSDPRSFGGLDLVAELRGLLVATGAKAGRFADDSTFGDYSNPLGQAFDVLALERTTNQGAPHAAITYLIAAQCKDGGFPDAFGAKACSSSPDATGLVLQALVAAGADCSASRALSWLAAHPNINGSYGSNAVDPTKPVVANVNSTAYATLGLVAAGHSTTRPVTWLTSVQNADGGLPTVPSASKASNVYATAQALPALARTSFLTIGPRPVSPRTPVCTPTGGGATVTVTSSSSSSSSTSPTAPTSSMSLTSSTSARRTASDTPAHSASGTTTTTSSTLGSGVTTGSNVPTPVSANGSLPRTGAEPLLPVAAGVLLLLVGLLLLLIARRPSGRRS